MSSKEIWHQSFRGRNGTGCYNLNFLIQFDNLFIMDNHLAAAWCWSKKISPGKKYDIIHIDMHYDFLESQLGLWCNAFGNKIPIELRGYLGCVYNAPGCTSQVIRYDNYLPIFCDINQNEIDKIFFFTHKYKCGDKPSCNPWRGISWSEIGIDRILSFLTGQFIENEDEEAKNDLRNL